jgi:hypothetical protein
MGPNGPYLLSGEILIPGLNRPVQSQAVNWATAGLLAGPRRCWPAFPAAAAAGHTEAATRAQHGPLSAVDYVFIMAASKRARSLASLRTLSVASVFT